MGADSQVPRAVAESLPREQPIDAYLSDVISQEGVEGELMQFRVSGIARKSLAHLYVVTTAPRARGIGYEILGGHSHSRPTVGIDAYAPSLTQSSQ
jgi:hypothetical protein